VYILLIYRDPDAWRTLRRDERAAVSRDHDAFQRSVPEIVFTEAFADPADVVDCDSRERAIELAARIPEARQAGVEIRELTYQFGTMFDAEAGAARGRET
jgi:hypothetical protein